MNKEELIGRLEMVYAGEKNALNELIGYYDGLKQGIEELQQENQELQQENKILKENAENNDKVVDKVNWENQLFKKENEQLKGNWNKLKEFIVKEYYMYLPLEASTKSITILIDKMQELQGSDSNE